MICQLDEFWNRYALFEHDNWYQEGKKMITDSIYIEENTSKKEILTYLKKTFFTRNFPNDECSIIRYNDGNINIYNDKLTILLYSLEIY